ncbi:hypothetical protein DH2020_038226 [Rehmannia glutinosa]|uniref:Beta-galactosidase n=1 Tax=Rehmannia glutinosa TaxID=99300 RepID=A0ABR0UZW5_REHGL
MAFKIAMCNGFLLGVLVLLSSLIFLGEASVSYDHKAISVNGQRKILISGSIHYPRSTPEMWPDLIQKAKEGGLDVIQTYVFWNGHEPEPGKYYFEGRYDLVKFIKLVHQAGLYVNLRIGPYACAEWNFGGFPVWLKYVPGISFRTNNGPFKAAMQKFTTKIVNMMKAEKLYETQGGPIILSQIENEYGPMEYELGAPGRAYADWAAKMAVDLGTGVPWIMCKQDDAPDPIINTCNGFYCDYFSPNKAYKPKMWTEAWTGWFTEFGGAVPYRPAEDLAFSVAKFIQKGGSFINYYMVFALGLKREPKWGHLKDLHRAIKLCEPALVSGDPTVTSLGNSQEAHVFKSRSGSCAAFLANYDQHSFAKVSFGNMHYNLPPWSISILPDCKNTVYNTARIGAQSAQMKMTPVRNGFSWQSYNEETASYDDDQSFTMVGLREQINTTRDNTDYLCVKIDSREGFLRGGKWPVLTVLSAGHALHVFINGQLSGTAYGSLGNPRLTFSQGVNLRAGVNKISLLSISVGLREKRLNMAKMVLQDWSKGESLSLHSLSGSSSVEWVEGSYIAERQPLTWYKTTFNAPAGNEPLALDMNTMSKGQVWINGQSIGRYWNQYKASANVVTAIMLVSRSSFLAISHGNLLVVFKNGVEILMGSLWRTGSSKRARGYIRVATDISELANASIRKVSKPLRPKAHLSCAAGQKISSIKFASFGTPQGFVVISGGSCHAFHSYDVFGKYCVGQQSCTVPVTPEIFGGDPCPSVMKKLSVEAICS